MTSEPELQGTQYADDAPPPRETEEVRDFDLGTSEPLSFTALEEARVSVFVTLRSKEAFATKVAEMPTSGDEGRRRGLGLWILGEYERCAEALAPYQKDMESPEAVTAVYTCARALLSLRRFDEATQLFQQLCDRHPDEPRPRAGLIEATLEARLASGNDDDAVAEEIRGMAQAASGGFAETGEGRYVLGRAAELRRDWEEALDHYEAGRAAQPDHQALLTRFAYLSERCGLDELAVELYQELVSRGAADRKVLLNLGVLYEDLGLDHDAAACYDTVVVNRGDDQWARLYLADAEAGTDMYYDEDLEKKEDRLNQILRIPITDFELSVRARNCLNKMQIMTLGDLVQRTEQELLSYKNFGETSLTEIKEILHSKGLRLGMPREEAVASIEAHANRAASSDRSNVLNKPILELSLSIRARRTVETLGCLTVGDILKHSAEELLGMPNFGQTSLQELRSKLQELGLKLKGD